MMAPRLDGRHARLLSTSAPSNNTVSWNSTRIDLAAAQKNTSGRARHGFGGVMSSEEVTRAFSGITRDVITQHAFGSIVYGQTVGSLPSLFEDDPFDLC